MVHEKNFLFGNSEQCKSQPQRFLTRQRAKGPISQSLASTFGGGFILGWWLGIVQFQGAWGRSIGYRKIPTWNDEKKIMRIYFAQRNGWLFWRVIRIAKLSKLKLHLDRTIFLRVCLDAHHAQRTVSCLFIRPVTFWVANFLNSEPLEFTTN